MLELRHVPSRWARLLVGYTSKKSSRYSLALRTPRWGRDACHELWGSERVPAQCVGPTPVRPAEVEGRNGRVPQGLRGFRIEFCDPRALVVGRQDSFAVRSDNRLPVKDVAC